MKKIPYGTADFDYVIQNDYYYIDKSRYIKTVEDENLFILLVRPRRMGKSMFTNMMMAYYDVAKKDQFQKLFGDLWIGKNPTPLANKFLVLKFDFSYVSGEIADLEKNFNAYCQVQFRDFIRRYSEFFTQEDCDEILSQTFVNNAINSLTAITRHKGLEVYLFIDEYDNFTNNVLSARGVKAHGEITHAEGFYRDFFKACKGTFRRIFLSGVTPVTYDDLTSGFNMADVVDLKPQFDQVIGVTVDELRQMIEYYREQGGISIPTDQIIAETKSWYNNFCFSEECYGQTAPVYNTNMIMRYMNQLVRSGHTPQEMIDHSACTDTEKLNYLVMAEDLDNRERRIEIVNEICAKGYTIGKVHEQFPAYSCGSEENFKSMLFYFGTITYGGWDEWGQTILRVPNKNMGELYLGYLQTVIAKTDASIEKEIKNMQDDIRLAALQGQWELLVNRIGPLYSHYSSLRNAIRGEADIQGFLRGVLCLNSFFALWPELELGGGYGDILLVPRQGQRVKTRHSYLIELKYLKAGDAGIESKVEEACRQLDNYAAEKRLADSQLLAGTTLTKLYLIFRGHELAAYGQHL